MARFCAKHWIMATLFGIAIFASPPPSRAAFQLIIQEVNSSGVVQFQATATSGTNVLNFNGTVGNFTISSVISTQNSGASGGIAQLAVGSFTAVLNNATTDSLRIISSATGFNFPSANPLLLTSHLGGSLGNAGASITHQSFVDNNNNLFGVTNSYASAWNAGVLGGFAPAGLVTGSNGALTPGLQSTSGGLFPVDLSTYFNASLPYSLSDVTIFSGLAQGFSSSANTDTYVATPEPASLMSGVLGCVLVGGFGRWMRRRPKTR